MRITSLAWFAIVIALPAAASTPQVPPPIGPAARVEALATSTPAWQVAWGRLDGRGDAIAYTSHTGTLSLQRDGERLWSVELGAFAWALALCDLDRDGGAEVIAAIATGEVRAYDARGALRWRATPGGHALALSCGRLVARETTHLAVGTTQGAVVVLDAAGREIRRLPSPFATRKPPAVRALDAGDTDGDGLDELLVANYERAFGVLDPRTGKALWRGTTKEPLPWIYGARFVDLEGDGRPEAAIGGQTRVVVADAKGERFERDAGRTTRGYRMALPAPVDLDGDGTSELAVLLGPELSVFDAHGERVYGATTAEYYFTAIAPAPRPGRQLLLGSIAGADQNVYRVTFGAGAERDELQALRDPPGPRTEIRRSLLALRDRVLAAPVDPSAAKRRFYVNLDNDASTLERLETWEREQRAFRAAYPYPNLVFHHNVSLVTRGPKARPLSAQLAVAEEIERRGFVHIVTVGHSLDGQNDLAAVEAWLARTPKTCIGVRVSELSIELGLGGGALDPRRALLDREVNRFYSPLLDLAARTGRHAQLLMKRNFWVLAPASSRYRDAFFGRGRRGVIVALEEASYTRAPENALMARVGLWRSGLLGAFGVRVIDDDLRLDRFFEYQSAGPDHVLRALVAGGAAGATHFSVKPRYLFRDLRGLGSRELAPGLALNDDGLASLDLFLHLLGKGLLDPPTPTTIESVAPVAFRFVEPAAAFVRESHRREIPDVDGARQGGLFTGAGAGLLPTPVSYVNRALLGVSFYGLAYYPANPYGLPSIVPDQGAGADATSLATDGEQVLLDGEWRSGPEAVDRVVARFRAAAAALPVRAEGAHWMATRRPDGALRVTLVDPSYLEPRARTVRLVAARPIASVRDVLGGEALAHEGREATVPLAAGAIRVLDVRLGAAETPSR